MSQYTSNMYFCSVCGTIKVNLLWIIGSTLEEARRFAHDTHIASILSTTGCLRFSLKMDFEVKKTR